MTIDCALPSLRALMRSLVWAIAFGLLTMALAGSAAAQGRSGSLPDADSVAQHLATGFALTGAHQKTRCESCHVRGVFKDTPKTCIGCHTQSARISSVTITSSHPPTLEQCSTCHNTVTFAGATFVHAGIAAGTCATCHNGTTATGKSAGHAATTGSCDSCHRTTGWKGVVVNHAGVAPGSCASCHNGVGAKTKSAAHIPTALACDSCHRTTAWSPAAMNHTGIATGCATCHDGRFPGVVGKSATHIPTVAGCETCHAGTTTFKGARFDHASDSRACATCHDNRTTAVGKPTVHIPTNAPCESCHRGTTVFTVWEMDHTGITGGCAACHADQYPGVKGKASVHMATTDDCSTCHKSMTTFSDAVGAKPANHIPTSQACAQCHANPADYKVYAMSHAGIAGGCATCHAAGTSFVNGVPKPPPATHVPTSQPCESCHAPTKFDKFAGGTMSHAGITSGCATCHAAGRSFAGGTATTPPATHIPFGAAACESCHAPAKFTGFGGTAMNHAPVAGVACAACHAAGKSFFGVTVVTPPTTHVPFGAAACESCHAPAKFTDFGGMAMNHAPVAGTPCATCHEAGRSWFGVTTVTRPSATKDPAHPPTGECGTCHASTSSFATGVTAKPATHVPTDQPCALCHAVPGTYAGGTMNHAGITTGCASCHAAGKGFFGVTVVTPPATHVPFGAAACESCHAPTKFGSFGATAMNHAPVAAIQCATCHEAGRSWYGVKIVTRPTAAQDAGHPPSGDCATCHTGTTSFAAGIAAKPANHITTAKACVTCHASPPNYKIYKMSHAGIGGACAACHAPGQSFAGGLPKAPPSTHLPVAGAACESCHAPADFTSFGGTAMNHAPVAGTTCSVCHAAGRSFYGVKMVTPPGNHVPFGVAGCESCHAPGKFASFGGTLMNHGPVAGTTCATCHETGRSWYGVTVVTRPTLAQDPKHPTTGECGSCHASTSSFAAGVAAKPSNHISTTAGCASCHTTPGNYAIATMNHAGITTGCATCHASGLAFANVVPVSPPATHVPTTQACELCHAPTKFDKFTGGTMNHAGIATGCASCHAAGKSFFGVRVTTPPATHIPVGSAACESCHAPARFTNFGATPMNHTPVAGAACATCHEAGRSWYGVTIVTRPTLVQDPNHPTTGECGTCHTSTSSFMAGITSKPANHIPTTQPCAMCHTTPGNYAGATMNHAGITTGCATCHATGKSFFGVTMVTPPATHIPVGTAACESCHAPTKFTNFGGTAMNHTPVAGTACATCHEAGRSWFGVTIVTRPTLAQDPNHPTTGECGNCHSSTSSFMAGITSKPANHIPTTQPCAMCHTTPGNYSVAVMNHTGITTGCATCHATGLTFANVVPVSPPATHIPVGTAACESCHAPTKFTNFGGTAMNHAPVAGVACATCHATGKSFFGVTVVTPPATHIPVGTAACESCHAPTKFTNFGGTAMNHAPVAGVACATCHATGKSFFGVTIVTPPATHIPVGTAACESCHAPTKFTNFGGTAMNHAPVAGTACATCHEAGRTWYGVTIVTRPTPAQDPNHPTTGECGGCHSSTTSFSAGITTKPTNHIPTTQPCATCHTTQGNYSVAVMNHTGITTGCATCHATGKSFANVTPVSPPATHIPSGATACEACHLPTKFDKFSGGTMNHTGITTGCATCHAAGKTFYGVTVVTLPSTGHIPNPASLDCSGCHTSTTSFKTWTMNHTGITTNCSACHGGQFTGVRKKPSDHPITTADCSQCHTTKTFSKAALATVTKPVTNPAAATASLVRAPASAPATAVAAPAARDAGVPATPAARGAIHATVMPGGCAACHNGAAAPGRPGKHLATALSCDSCHRTTAWIPANFTHSGATTGTCATCHNGSGASGKPASHFVTMRSCDSCHRVTSWRPVLDYRHLSPLYTVHAPGTGCVACHVGNSELVNWRYPNLKPGCGGCHGADFRGGHQPRPMEPPISTKPGARPHVQ